MFPVVLAVISCATKGGLRPCQAIFQVKALGKVTFGDPQMCLEPAQNSTRFGGVIKSEMHHFS